VSLRRSITLLLLVALVRGTEHPPRDREVDLRHLSLFPCGIVD
jgi:hypothetical protein